MLAPWPEYTEEWNFAKEEADVETIKVLVKGIRNIRSEMNVPPSRKAKYFIVSPDENLRELFASHKDIYIRDILEKNDFNLYGDIEEQNGKFCLEFGQATPEGEDWNETIWSDFCQKP